ncbi:Tlg2-vesicle protein [Fusarium piperis]|uniref:Golgi apparatus membrane protein TVP38 n=1 Tax=Fusarium piperis TaxID=1435070 RepID=A0A9W8WFS9_9HYPO|nr:Tlg2-vesicle protein [Fusarium piperis]
MPADYQSTAQALALSPDRSTPSPSPNRPPWTTISDSSTSHTRRLSNPLMRRRRNSVAAAGPGFARRIWASVNLLGEQTLKIYLRMSPVQRLLAALGAVVIAVLGVLAIIFSRSFFKWLDPVAEKWRALPGGWILAFLLVFVTSFPPLMGYSTASTIAGYVYGFPWGWPIVASGCTFGALCAFLASRTVLSGYVDRMVGRDHRFIALGQVLRQEGIWYLTAIRFCPLPFSLSNGFLATIPSITPLSFALSTALSSPKLLVHVFIGSRIALLAEKGDQMTAGDKAINYLSMLVGVTVGIVVGLIIYRRTMARAAQLAREDGLDPAALATTEEGEAGYMDSDNSPLMDPEDAAVLMSDDDISLWERDGLENRYHDDDDDEESNKRRD